VELLPIDESARKHGISDADMRHAVSNYLREVLLDDRSLFLGVDRAGRLLEVVVIKSDGDPAIIHADYMRAKFLPFLGKR
jgi:hypothetical protein